MGHHHDIFERFKSEPDLVTEKVFNLIDDNGDGHISREEWLRRAPEVLFNASFLEKTAEIYSDEVVNKRLNSAFVFQEKSEICEMEDMQNILLGCPKYCYWMEWHLLYTTGKDGFSFQTVKNAVGSLHEVLIIIRTTENILLGGFASEHVKFDGKVHGNPDNFIFAKDNTDGSVGIFSAGADGAAKFHVASKDSITFGPDTEKNVALYISEHLMHGKSTSSSTYQNPPLVPGADFKIKSLEIWGPT